jgi:phospholipid transport system substrate-binding protein
MGVKKASIKKMLAVTAVGVLTGAFSSAAVHQAEAAVVSIQIQDVSFIEDDVLRSAYEDVMQAADEAGKSSVNAGAEKFINGMADRAIGFLTNPDTSLEVKRAEFQSLLKDSFDMKTIGRFSLGRYWRVSTPQQRDEYQRLFENMVIAVYSSRFEEYKGQRFETRGYRADGEKDTIVSSFVVPEEGPEVQVDWRVRYKNGRYKVIDVIVEGVSMSLTQRSDFAAVIQRGGGNVQVLLSHLQASY